MESSTSRRQIGRVLWITMLLNLSVAAGKIIVGSISGALAITADGFHSLVDSTSNLIGLIANHLASQPPDAEHPYGHRRFETLAALLIGAFLVLAAWEIARGAVDRLQSGDQPDLTPLTFAVLIGTLIVNIVISTYEAREGKRLNSEFLLADASQTRADVFVTLSVMFSMVLVLLTGWAWIDAVAALVVVVLIGRVAWRILHQTGSVLVDTAPYTPQQLEALVEDVPAVMQVVRARSRGPVDAAHVDIDVQVAPEMTAEHASAITTAIRERLETNLEGVSEVEVHFVPDDSGRRDYALAARAVADTLGVATHEVNLIETPSKRILEMHVEVPAGQTLSEAHDVVSRLERDILGRLPEIAEVVTHIEPAASEERGEVLLTEQAAQVKQQALGLLTEHYPRIGWHHLRVYDHNGEITLTIHAALLSNVTVEFAHNIAERAETLLRTNMPQLNRVTIHTEPYNQQ